MWFKKFFLTLAILFFSALMMVPRIKVVQDLVRARLFDWYEQSLGCSATCERLSFSLMSSTIELTHVQVQPRDQASTWRWESDRVELHASWFGLLFQRIFDLSITLDGAALYSEVSGRRIALVEEHFKRYFAGPQTLPLRIQQIVLRHAHWLVRDQEHAVDLDLVFSCDYKRMGSTYGFNIHCDDGALLYDSRVIMQSLKGYWQSVLDWTSGSVDVKGQGQGEVTFLHGEHAEFCYWEAKKDGDAATAMLWRPESGDHVTASFKKTATDIELDASLSFTLSRLAEHCVPHVYARMVQGQVKGECHAHLGDTCDGLLTVTVSDGGYGKHQLFKEALFSMPLKKGTAYAGDMALTFSHDTVCRGTWSWSPEKREGAARLINHKGVELGLFSLKPDAHIADGYVATSVLQVPDDEDQERSFLVKAKAHYCKGALQLQAERDAEQFFLAGQLGEVIRITTLRWIDGANKTLIDLAYSPSEGHRINGVIDVGAVQRLLKRVAGFDLHGEGVVEVRGHYDKGQYELSLDAPKIAVRLPHIYNVVNALNGKLTFDPQSSLLEITDVQCSLHRGSLSVPRATFQYNSDEESLTYEVPCMLTSFWFNLEKDLYALFSGSLVFKKEKDALPLLSGEVWVDRAHVSESAFAMPFIHHGKQVGALGFSSPLPVLGLNVTVRSKNPVRVSMARLEGDAYIDMHVGNTTTEPSLSGSIRVATGTIVFPYKPLMIRKAQLTFTPQQSFDPAIEVFAKNTIKGYDISLLVNGTLSAHDLRLQSAPPLTEEQIIGLLYTGSDQGVLGAVVPSVENLASLFLKNDGRSSKNNTGKHSWRETLRHIHLVPSFTDQHGRGGLRGTLEVEINDRWRALMQKNFSLSEDTRFELDYAVSDDMCVRALRDERRDIGAEVEMKVKF